MRDAVGNARYFNATDLQDAGFPNSFQNADSDTTAPQTTIDSGPSGTVNQATADFTFSSSESGSTFECKLDGGGFTACSSPKALAGLSGGAHTLSVRATDPAANLDATPATRTWTVDTAAPQTTIDSGPSGTVGQTNANFGFSSSESGSSYACKLDSDAWTPCSSPEAYVDLSDGAHTFSVAATDAADNADSTPATRTWTVDSTLPPDSTAPQTTINSGPFGMSNQTTANFGFSSSEPGSSYECELDSEPWASCSSPEMLTSLPDGDHTFKVLATDAANNTDPTAASRTWTVDTIDPQTTIGSGPSGTVTQTAATFTFSSDNAGSSFECRLDGGAFTACSSPETRTNLADGDHTFKVIATDAADNTDPTAATRTWTVDTATPPATTAPPAASPLPTPAVPGNGPDVVGPTSSSCSAASLRPTARGVVTFRCGSFNEPVTGTLALRTATKVRYRGKTRVIALGSKRFAAPVGQKVVIKIKISKQGRQLLRKLRQLRVKATLTARDTANNATLKSSTISLKR